MLLGIAQMVARMNGVHEVAGSNPVTQTINLKAQLDAIYLVSFFTISKIGGICFEYI